MIYILLSFIGAVICANEKIFTGGFIEKYKPPLELQRLIEDEKKNIFPLNQTKDCGVCFLKPGDEWDRLIGNAGIKEVLKNNTHIANHFEVVEKFFFPSFDRHGILAQASSAVIASKIVGEPVTQMIHAEVKYLLYIAEKTGLGIINPKNLIRSSIDDEKIYIVNTEYEHFWQNNPKISVAKMLLSSKIHLHDISQIYLDLIIK